MQREDLLCADQFLSLLFLQNLHSEQVAVTVTRSSLTRKSVPLQVSSPTGFVPSSLSFFIPRFTSPLLPAARALGVFLSRSSSASKLSRRRDAKSLNGFLCRALAPATFYPLHANSRGFLVVVTEFAIRYFDPRARDFVESNRALFYLLKRSAVTPSPASSLSQSEYSLLFFFFFF